MCEALNDTCCINTSLSKYCASKNKIYFSKLDRQVIVWNTRSCQDFSIEFKTNSGETIPCHEAYASQSVLCWI